MYGISGTACTGSAPIPSHTMPKASLTSFSMSTWALNSRQVSRAVRSGAPDSSICPPGSSVIEAPSFLSPMMFGPSMIGAQPTFARTASSSAPMPRSPSYGTRSSESA